VLALVVQDRQQVALGEPSDRRRGAERAVDPGELGQLADALTARRALDPAAPARITIRTGVGGGIT
jgi:hypothetical protein